VPVRRNKPRHHLIAPLVLAVLLLTSVSPVGAQTPEVPNPEKLLKAVEKLTEKITELEAKVRAAEQKAVAKPTAPPVSNYRIQLAAHRSRVRAEANWRRMVDLSEGFLAGLEPRILRADLGQRGIVHRLQIDGPGGYKKSTALCEDLKGLGLTCFVVRRAKRP